MEDMHYSKDRDDRVKDTGEVFTPPELVNKMLNQLDYDWDTLPERTFLDPTCGSLYGSLPSIAKEIKKIA